MPFQVLPSVPTHPREEVLEEYSFGRVHEPLLTVIENHLLICDLCRQNLEELEAYAALVRSVASKWERPPKKESTTARMFAFTGGPKVALSLVAAMAAVLASAAVFEWRAPASAGSSTVQLVAMRGGNIDSKTAEPTTADGLAIAPARRPVVLEMDGAHLPPSPEYRIKIVDHSGVEVWSGAAEANGSHLSARLTEASRPGIYWVRLYTSGGELLREFGMRVQ